MLGLILFLAIFGYFVYNVIYMSKHTPINFLDGLYMFFCQGAVDLVAWLKEVLAKK